MNLSPMKLAGFAWLSIILAAFFCILTFLFESNTFATTSALFLISGLGFGFWAVVKEFSRDKTTPEIGGQ